MEQYLALNASAGSGKTYALTLRYISLLFLDINPSTILTLTFTNKAASEMNERIFKTLISLKMDNHTLKEISKQTNIKLSEILLKTDEVLARFLSNETSIITLDSFINKILREFCGYIDVGDDFSIDNDNHDLMLYKFLLSLKQKDFQDLINFSHTSDKNLNAIIDLFIILDDKNSDFKIVEFSNNLLTTLENEILQSAYTIKKFLLSTNLSNQAFNALNFDNIKSLLNVGKTWLTKNSLKEYSYFKKAEIPSFFDNELTKIKSNLNLYFKYKEIGILNNLFTVFNNFRTFRYKYKKAKNCLQFNDITNLVYLLLQEYISKDFLSFRLDASYNHILIDEFQDTSVMQYKILEPLIEEILSGNNDKYKTFFYVGDIKQSIYRFRGGKKELFNFVANKYNKLIKLQILNKNFRSSINIVNFINNIFLNIQNYEYHEQLVESRIDGLVEILNMNIKTEFQENDNHDEKFNFLKEKLNELHTNGIDLSNVAILTYTNDDVLEIYEYLRKNFKDIKIVTDMTSKLINHRNVKAIINLIKYFYFKADIYKENFNILMGFELLDKIEFETDLKSVDLVLLVKDISIYYNILEDNVLKFIEDLNKYSDVVDFVYEVSNNNTAMVGGETIGLQILTIFKAKGLEFDTVLLLDRIKNKNTDRSSLLFEYNSIDLHKIYYKEKIREEFDIEYKKAIEHEKNQIINDELNILYVAMTRARYNLIIFKKEKQSIFELLGDIVSESKTGTLFLGDLTQKKHEDLKQNIKYSPLSLGTQDINKKPKINNDDIKARYFGLATHYCLEMMNTFDEKSIIFSMNIVKDKFSYILNKEEFLDIEYRVKNLINNKTFLSILGNHNYKKEQSLIYDNELKIIDLLICDDTGYTIIDYKTTTNQHNEHIQQVKDYVKAVQEITSLDTEGYLVYLQKDGTKIIKID